MELLILFFLLLLFLVALSMSAWILAIGAVAVFLGMVPLPYLLLAAVVWMAFKLMGESEREEHQPYCTCHTT